MTTKPLWSARSLALAPKLSRVTGVRFPRARLPHFDRHDLPETFLDLENAPSLPIPQFGTPRQIACYSRSSVYKHRPNSTISLRRFVEPALGTNLKEGMDLFYSRPKKILKQIHKRMRLDSLMEACVNDRVRVGFLKADVVTTKQAIVRCVLPILTTFPS